MDELAPVGAVYQAGTLSGNPLATAAGLAVLAQLDDDAYVELERKTAYLVGGLGVALAAAEIDAQTPRAFTLAGLFFSATEVRDYDDARKADSERYARFFHGPVGAGCVRGAERL